MFWSIIAANKRKTVLLIAAMGLFLVLLGAAIGVFVAGDYHPYAGFAGAGIAALVWAVMLLASLYASDSVLLSISNAHQVDRDTYPQLYNLVEEMVIAGSLPAMPKVYVVDDPAPNAFAMGKSPKDSHICVTAGLLAVCGRDELQGVVAHELGHIMNRDLLYMTVAATMLGSMLLISDVFLRSFRYSTMRYTSRSRRSSGKGAVVILIVSLVLAILAPILARILYFSISRKREYLADATSARLTRYPEGLASALEKIGGSTEKLVAARSVTAPFYIVNPTKQSLHDSVFATHPPLSARIKVLRSMAGGAGYLDYMKAYIQVTRKRQALIPAADLKGAGKVEIRAANAAGPAAGLTAAESRRRAGDIMRAVNKFAFVTCQCGLEIKLPPEYAGDTVSCPRCKRVHSVIRPGAKATGAVLSASAAMNASAAVRPESVAQDYSGPGHAGVQQEKLNPGKWQTITCHACGRPYEISPSFGSRKLVCSGCGSLILFSPASEAVHHKRG